MATSFVVREPNVEINQTESICIIMTNVRKHRPVTGTIAVDSLLRELSCTFYVFTLQTVRKIVCEVRY